MDIVWIGFAFTFGILVNRIHIPPLVGYLFAGLLLSLTGYEGGELLSQISHLGVIFLLFTVGLHINLRNVLQIEVLGVGSLHLILSTAIFTPVCLYFGMDVQSALIVAISLGFSSTVLTAKMLESRNEMGAFYGRMAIGVLILQDLAAIGLIAYSGGGIPSPWALTLLALPLLRPLFSRLLELVSQDELVMLMALSLAMGGDLLFTSLNLSGELGALVVGMLFANDERGDQLEKKIWSIKETFLVGFFLEIGLGGFPAPESLYFIGVFFLLLPLKGALFFLLFMIFKLRSRTGFLASLTLTAYSEFTLIAGTVAASAGLIPQDYIVILGMLTATSFIVNSLLILREDSIWDSFRPLFIHFERNVRHIDKQPFSVGAAEYLVVGMGTTGAAAYDRIKSRGGKPVGIDINPDILKYHLDLGRRVVYADAQDVDMWEQLDMINVKSIIISMSSNIHLKHNLVKLIRKKTWFRGGIYVITANAREDEVIMESGALPVSIPAVQVGKEMADISMDKSE